MARRLGLLLLLGFMTLAASAAPVEQRYLGYATDLETGAYRYTEVHRHRYDGNRWLGGSIRYVAPDGRLLGEKTLDFSRDPFVPLTRYRLTSPAYEEVIRAVGPDRVDMEKFSDGRRETASLARAGEFAADSGFHAYIVANLDALRAGQVKTMRLGVVGQLDQYRFRIRKLADLQREGEPSLRLQIEPDSLLRFLVPSLTVVYGLQSQRLLEYVGVSNLLDPQTGKAWNVRIVYTRQPPAGAPRQVLALLDGD